MERKIRDQSLRIWRAALAGGWESEARVSPMRRIRESWPYQRFFQLIKWYVLPTLFGLLINRLTLWLVSIVVAQIVLAWKEPRDHFCSNEPGPVPPIDRPVRLQFDVSSPCTPVRAGVVADQDYQIVFELLDDGGRQINGMTGRPRSCRKARRWTPCRI